MSPLLAFSVPSTLPGLLILIAALVILWIVVSIPVYISGELITDGRASLGDAMAATLGGAIVYVLVMFAGAFLLTPILGYSALVVSFVLALVAWLAVYRASFDTGWFGALVIVVVGWVVLFVMDVILTSLFGVSFPKFYPF
jgi:hypothetical protein